MATIWTTTSIWAARKSEGLNQYVGCQPLSWCGLCTFKKTCTTYQDCCQENMGAYTCGADFPFLYECIDNLCENPWCSEDGHCDVFFEQLDDANPGRYVGLGCVEL